MKPSKILQTGLSIAIGILIGLCLAYTDPWLPPKYGYTPHPWVGKTGGPP